MTESPARGIVRGAFVCPKTRPAIWHRGWQRCRGHFKSEPIPRVTCPPCPLSVPGCCIILRRRRSEIELQLSLPGE